MVLSRRTGKWMFALLCFALFVMEPAFLLGSGSWKKVAVTEQKDVWYVEQVLGFSSKGSVVAARARLKFVAGNESAIGQNVKKRLLSDGVNADTFHYFVESVEVDCKKKLFTISRIDFFDSEDVKISGQAFIEPKQYPSTPGSAFEIISWDLCQNKPCFIDTIKDTLNGKKPFLYFYPQGETAK
jgi:hypothetical protein